VIGDEKVKKLTNTNTAFLIDPYRKWIKTDEEIRKLDREAKRG
jgi:glutaconate CoA-transferase subunit A